jgi:molybdate-binding protein/DNA-binding transcriptional regulator YhcF (GntR family)
MKKTETYLYQEIAESLRRRIASGEFEPGDKLPPVRKMAERWQCTPGTVSRAYTQLSEEGLVEGRRGAGTRVAPDALQSNRPLWGWATLVNRAEQFVLDVLSSGYSPEQAESALAVAIARWRDLQRQGIPPLKPDVVHQTAALHFVGSHDLAVELMAQMLTDTAPEIDISMDFVGSLGGLIALVRGEAQIAGVHLWDETTDTYNVPFVRRLLPGREVVLVTLVHRSLGLITPPGNPQDLQSLADLARADVRLVNRQSGSGTRVWLDSQLKASGIPPTSVRGFDREELTHLSVARAVEQGEATVGLGIYAAASAFGLGFVPLTQEQYQLAFPASSWQSPEAEALVRVIRSSRFKQAVANLGGYDTAKTGTETWVS